MNKTTPLNNALGLYLKAPNSQPFRKRIEGNPRIFKQFAEQTPLPYVPVVTVGWDRRPWEEGS